MSDATVVHVVLVAGSRDYAHLEQVVRAVSTIQSGSLVLTGGARGVDRTAHTAALARGYATRTMPADWKQYGKRAGLLRNTVLVELCHEALIFHDGVSRGTTHTLALLDACGKPYILFGPNGDPLRIVGTSGYRVAVSTQGGVS